LSKENFVLIAAVSIKIFKLPSSALYKEDYRATAGLGVVTSEKLLLSGMAYGGKNLY
jgi:hypothetical protein